VLLELHDEQWSLALEAKIFFNQFEIP